MDVFSMSARHAILMEEASRDGMIEYCQNDVFILRMACTTFATLYETLINVNPLKEAITIAGACLLTFKKNFFKDDHATHSSRFPDPYGTGKTLSSDSRPGRPTLRLGGYQLRSRGPPASDTVTPPPTNPPPPATTSATQTQTVPKPIINWEAEIPPVFLGFDPKCYHIQHPTVASAASPPPPSSSPSTPPRLPPPSPQSAGPPNVLSPSPRQKFQFKSLLRRKNKTSPPIEPPPLSDPPPPLTPTPSTAPPPPPHHYHLRSQGPVNE
ncbi:hypothetical protein J437_LFUL019269 [Ladona fulva]|uniref:Uncharacterized protein n=1 Tax=Ladona fulva TaxID=123851 RepID=A0A8K0KWU3_LADFU|nr:hypothetical protein J437_LFUL019269 [Ladona fulva]